MDAEQRAHYDEFGYLHLRSVLDTSLLAQLNAVYDERLHAEILTPEERAGRRRRERGANFDTQSQRYTHLRQFWDSSYASLIDHPTIVPILRELLCDPAWGATFPTPTPPTQSTPSYTCRTFAQGTCRSRCRRTPDASSLTMTTSTITRPPSTMATAAAPSTRHALTPTRLRLCVAWSRWSSS